MNPERGIERQQGFPQGVDNVLCVHVDLLQLSLGPATLRYVLHRQHEQLGVAPRTQFPGVEQYDPSAYDRKRVREFKIIEDLALGNDILEEDPQGRYIPLAVSQLVDKLVLGFFGGDLERLVKRPIGASHSQGCVQHQQGFSHRIHDVLSVGFNVFDDGFGFWHSGHETRLGVLTSRELSHLGGYRLAPAAM